MKTKEEKFILKEDGIYWIEKIPEKDNFAGTDYNRIRSRYEAALQSAIDSAVKVSNQQEVYLKLIEKERLNNDFGWTPKVGQVYSLECAVEKKQHCEQNGDACPVYDSILHKTVALVTFPQSKEDNPIRTKEEIIKAVIQVCKAHAEDGCLDIEGSEANALRIVGPWIDQISSSYRSGEESK